MRENRSWERVREFGDILFSAFRLPSVRSVNPQTHKPKSPPPLPLPKLPVLCLSPFIHSPPIPLPVKTSFAVNKSKKAMVY